MRKVKKNKTTAPNTSYSNNIYQNTVLKQCWRFTLIQGHQDVLVLFCRAKTGDVFRSWNHEPPWRRQTDTVTAWDFHSSFSFQNRWKLTQSHFWFLYWATKMMNCTQILYKVCGQGSHFVFGFFGIGPSSSASSPSTSPGTTAPRVPHGGMFELHKILEDGIAENTARMLRLTSGKRSTSLVEVHCDESGVAGVTALLSDLHGDTATLESAQRIKQMQNTGH